MIRKRFSSIRWRKSAEMKKGVTFVIRNANTFTKKENYFWGRFWKYMILDQLRQCCVNYSLHVCGFQGFSGIPFKGTGCVRVGVHRLETSAFGLSLSAACSSIRRIPLSHCFLYTHPLISSAPFRNTVVQAIGLQLNSFYFILCLLKSNEFVAFVTRSLPFA